MPSAHWLLQHLSITSNSKSMPTTTFRTRPTNTPIAQFQTDRKQSTNSQSPTLIAAAAVSTIVVLALVLVLVYISTQKNEFILKWIQRNKTKQGTENTQQLEIRIEDEEQRESFAEDFFAEDFRATTRKQQERAQSFSQLHHCLS